MLEFEGMTLIAWVERLLWPFFRVGAFLLAAPVFGAQLVPLRVRTLLGLVMTLVILPGLPEMPRVDPLSLGATVIIAQELLIGLAFGFLLQLFVHIFALAGQMLALQMGLGMASMNDPANGVTVAVVGQIYLMFGTLLFLTLNGHLVVLEVMLTSFSALPVGSGLPLENLYTLAGLLGWVFASALVMALPGITAILLCNLVFGVMTRAAPQLNIFSLGFPMTMLFGLLVLAITSAQFGEHYARFLGEVLQMLSALAGV